MCLQYAYMFLLLQHWLVWTLWGCQLDSTGRMLGCRKQFGAIPNRCWGEVTRPEVGKRLGGTCGNLLMTAALRGLGVGPFGRHFDALHKKVCSRMKSRRKRRGECTKHRVQSLLPYALGRQRKSWVVSMKSLVGHYTRSSQYMPGK